MWTVETSCHVDDHWKHVIQVLGLEQRGQRVWYTLGHVDHAGDSREWNNFRFTQSLLSLGCVTVLGFCSCPGSCSLSQRLPCQRPAWKQRLPLRRRGEKPWLDIGLTRVHMLSCTWVTSPSRFQLNLNSGAYRPFRQWSSPHIVVRVWDKPFPVSTSLSCWDVMRSWAQSPIWLNIKVFSEFGVEWCDCSAQFWPPHLWEDLKHWCFIRLHEQCCCADLGPAFLKRWSWSTDTSLWCMCLQDAAELDMFCLDLKTWTWTQM